MKPILDIHLMQITATSMNQICDLSETFSTGCRNMVTDNAHPIAEIIFTNRA